MKALVTITAICLLSVTCSCNLLRDYPYHPPEDLQDGLQVGTLEELKIDTQSILEAAGRIWDGKYREVHSMLIYKDDLLVFEAYFPGHDYQWDAPNHHADLVSWDSHMPHYAHSVSKSITSLCVGIAIDKGFIRDVHQSIFDYLPDYQYLRTEQNKHITIEHLLTGTSGLQWAEWNAPLSSIENDQIGAWFHEPGPVDFMLGRPMIAEPGTHFIYSGGNIDLLGVIVENASGMTFPEFSREYLFDPLGLEQAHWDIIFPTGETHAAGGLRATPREMIKLGALMLKEGIWNGEEIISADWVEKCKFPFPACTSINIPGEDMGKVGYSYAWWTKKIDYRGSEIHWYSAGGWGGQKIIVLPELNSVVVFTGGTYTQKVKEYAIMEDFILPALID